MPVLYQQHGGELRGYNRQEINLELARLITRLFVYFNSKPNDVQIEDTINDIFSTFPDITLAELQLAFKRLRTGHYEKAGKIFGSFDPQKIFDVVRLTYTEGQEYRCEVRENKVMALKQHETKNSVVNLVPVEAIRELREKIEARSEQVKVIPINERKNFEQRKQELLKKFHERMEEIGEPLEDKNQSA